MWNRNNVVTLQGEKNLNFKTESLMRHNNFVFILALVIISSIVYSCDKDKLEDSEVPVVIESKEENNEVHNQLILRY